MCVSLRTAILVLTMTFAAHAVLAQPGPDDPVLATMRQELDRSLRNFKKVPLPPYFLAYELTDNRAVNVSTSFGSLISTSDQTTRVLDVDVRVGDFKLDNTHPIREQTEYQLSS